MALDAGAIPTALAAAVAREDFNLMKAIIDASFPMQSVDLDALQVTTGKIALLAVTAAQLGALACETAKIDALAVTAAKLAVDAVETAKIKNLNVTLGKAALGFGRYVGLATAISHFTEVDFTLDGAWHNDGLDLTGLVPAGAIGVVLSLNTRDNAAGVNFQVRCNGTTKSANTITSYTQVANIWTPYTSEIMFIDADRLLDYKGPAGFDDIRLRVVGWFT